MRLCLFVSLLETKRESLLLRVVTVLVTNVETRHSSYLHSLAPKLEHRELKGRLET